MQGMLIFVDFSIRLSLGLNEWVRGEQSGIEISKDIEPSKELGDKYLRSLKDEIGKFKNGE